MIHITNGRTDDIIGFFTQKDTTFNEHTQNLETHQDSFEFSTFGDHKYTDTLTDMNRLIIPAEDGGYSEYVINTVRKSRDRTSKVRVKSFASYQMLSVAKVIRPTSLSAYTPSQALGFITNGTEWRPGIVESNATRTFHIENYTDPLSFLKTVANEFELEIRFRVETDGKRVTGRFIDLLEQVGEWRGREITFGKDLASIERTEDFGNIYTKLICLGTEDEEGNRLEIEVTDDDALRRWGRHHPITGELMHLEDFYEPISDREDMTESELRQYGRTELNKRINSIVTYEAEVVDLENVSGMANKKIRFGDTVRIKDEKFNPPLYVEARIFEQRRDIFTKSNKKVKFGDFIERTEDELKATVSQLRKEIKTQIEKVTQQFNDAIKLLEEKIPSLTPGPKNLANGDMDAGFYGFVPSSELITGDDLASEIMLTEGESQHSSEGWLKYSWQGKTCFVAKKPYRHSLSWKNINDVGAVFGTKTVKIDGQTYKVRLMRGALTNPSENYNSDTGARGSEWNRIMLPIHEQATDGSWEFPANVEEDVKPFVHKLGTGKDGMYTDADLLTHLDEGNGSTSWTQEYTKSHPDSSVVRGLRGVSYSGWYLSYGNHSSGIIFGWRPVLEHVD